MGECDERLKKLNAMLDGELPDDLCRQLQEHLDDCPACRVVLDTLQQTIRLFEGQREVAALPVPFRERLHRTLRDKWNQALEG
jgi:anti-sigma factor (TIGR02949 family)